MKLLQEQEMKTNIGRRTDDELIIVQQTKEKAFHNTHLRQYKIKEAFDRHTKVDDFEPGDWVLKWDRKNEDKGKHGKFDNLLLGLFKIVAYHGSNTYFLQESNGEFTGEGPLNDRFLKYYIV
jgi:hypothetical protein